MKYLRKYNTFEEYNTDKNNLPSPSIAYVQSTNTIYYNGDGYNNQSVIADGDTIIYNTDQIYQKKDGSIYPVSHPDLSTQPSILPQRYGNLDIKEVLIANGREDEIPLSATIIEAFSFNKKECVSAICMKGPNKWSITNTEGIIPEFTLIRYVGDDLGYYYEEEGEENNQEHDYSKNYLTFKSLEDGTFQFTNAINYSVDNGTTWIELAADTATPTIITGNKIMWKAELTPGDHVSIGSFSSTGQFDVEGNIMSLLYGDEFIGQTDLTNKSFAFANLFINCKLINAKHLLLPTTILASYCYNSMFSNCSSLTTAPELPAITLAGSCYENMFNNCTSLTTAPELPATTLETYCYRYMFQNCTSLMTAPILPATTLISDCYSYMFSGCTSLNYIAAMFTTTPSNSYTNNWVNGVAATGTFIKNPDATWNVTGNNGIPTGWTVKYADLRYLTFEALQNGVFKFTNPINYSTDNGTTWTSLAANTGTTVLAGHKIMWKATLTSNNDSGIGTFSSTCNFNVEGNVMSLLYGDNFAGRTNLTSKNYIFYNLFKNCSKLINAENLSLPATTLAIACYKNMFYNCTSLTTVPELPATTLANNCYEKMFYNCTSLTTTPELSATTLADYCYTYMFQDCTSLTTAPELPATTLVQSCYRFMFDGCISLTTAPELPATTLANSCYYSMFSDCTSLTVAPELPATTLADWCYSDIFHGCISLTTAPELPATTLANSCYRSMFYGCTALTTAPELPATTLVINCYGYMFQNCTSLTTAPELSATTLASYCYTYMFSGCTSLTAAPVLNATTLVDYCYQGMFYGCTNLTVAPELPATTLVTGCYQNMFNGCTNLNYIKAMFTTTQGMDCTINWVGGVAATGTFIKNSAATWTTTGANGIPTGWTVQTASS